MTRFSPTREHTPWLELKVAKKKKRDISLFLSLYLIPDWMAQQLPHAMPEEDWQNAKRSGQNRLVQLVGRVNWASCPKRTDTDRRGTRSLAVSAVIMLFAAVGLFLHIWDASYPWLLLEFWVSATDVIFKVSGVLLVLSACESCRRCCKTTKGDFDFVLWWFSSNIIGFR